MVLFISESSSAGVKVYKISDTRYKKSCNCTSAKDDSELSRNLQS